MPPKPKKTQPRINVPHWGQFINTNPLNPNYQPPAAAAAPAAPGAPSTPTAAQQSAYDLGQQWLANLGLSSLAPKLFELVQQGVTDEASQSLALQNTNEWKTRFAGNEQLRAAGLPVMSVGEYLSTERAYGQAMRNFGLPAGFYDDPSDFAGFIGNNVSANELNQRLSAYSDLANNEDPQLVAQLQSMGMTKGDIMAQLIDPNRAAPLIQERYRQYQTALLGTASRNAGYVADNSYLDHLNDLGVTAQQASQGFGAIGESLADAQRLGLTAEELQSEVFENNADAKKKRKRLASQERGAFGGSSGVAGGSLNQNTSGQY